MLQNIYGSPAELYTGGETLYSREGTTQGDPLARKLKRAHAKQVWYADDATCGGRLQRVKAWWNQLNKAGPAFGYLPNSSKTWLVVKETKKAEAEPLFNGTGINIICQGRQLVLGSAVGTEAFVRSYVENKIDSLVLELSKIAGVAKTQPQSAYAALTHGLAAKWLFISRTTPSVADLFVPVEQAIQEQLIPKMKGRDTLNLQEREILALPTRLGGLSLNIPTLTADLEFINSRLISFP